MISLVSWEVKTKLVLLDLEPVEWSTKKAAWQPAQTDITKKMWHAKGLASTILDVIEINGIAWWSEILQQGKSSYVQTAN